MATPISRRHFLKRCSRCALLWAGLPLLSPGPASRTARAAALQKGLIGKKLSPYYTPLGKGAIRCDLCPHACEVGPGERGLCEVRENIDGRYYSLVYANPCAVHVDPIEKKPFYHVLPTTRSFSIATAGCNFNCKFCQNWEISQARPEETYNYRLLPQDVVRQALAYRCHSIASTYVEPTIFMEYMLETGRLAKAAPLLKVMHSNGFINPAPLDDLCRYLDAACIDLKGFSKDFYRDMAEGMLEPVLNTLKQLKSRGIHTEIVNLVVPGKNDDPKMIKAMCRWIGAELGPDTPLHFSRFYPRYKLKGTPPTPVETLENACKTAKAEGLLYVYIGNVAYHPAEHTYCPKCGEMLIKRIGYSVQVTAMTGAHCNRCGEKISGIWKMPAA